MQITPVRRLVAFVVGLPPESALWSSELVRADIEAQVEDGPPERRVVRDSGEIREFFQKHLK